MTRKAGKTQAQITELETKLNELIHALRCASPYLDYEKAMDGGFNPAFEWLKTIKKYIPEASVAIDQAWRNGLVKEYNTGALSVNRVREMMGYLEWTEDVQKNEHSSELIGASGGRMEGVGINQQGHAEGGKGENKISWQREPEKTESDVLRNEGLRLYASKDGRRLRCNTCGDNAGWVHIRDFGWRCQCLTRYLEQCAETKLLKCSDASHVGPVEETREKLDTRTRVQYKCIACGETTVFLMSFTKE